MDNLGDWLYIVLLVIAGIGGILNAGKKKKEGQPTEVLGEPDYDYEPEDPYREITLPPPPEPADTKKKTPKTQKSYIPLFREGEQTFATPAGDLFSDPSLDDEHQGISGDTFQDMEEVKKAIVYSEILHRKY
jgi:hypothetical protein